MDTVVLPVESVSWRLSLADVIKASLPSAEIVLLEEINPWAVAQVTQRGYARLGIGFQHCIEI